MRPEKTRKRWIKINFFWSYRGIYKKLNNKLYI